MVHYSHPTVLVLVASMYQRWATEPVAEGLLRT